MDQAIKLSVVESVKAGSHGLRGSLAAELAAGGAQVSEDAYHLLKFHGSYEQFDRDSATARKQAGLEKAYQFMARVRMPGGRVTAAQYLLLDRLADDCANGTLRVTTRQGIQFHGILKGDLKTAIARVNDTLLTTLCACGDVARNITASPRPVRGAARTHIDAIAARLSQHLLPQTRSYFEIFLDQSIPADTDETETLYGDTYLPRKFKIGITTPDDNSIDVLTNDLAIVPIFDGDRLLGYNIAIGGGLGMTHNKPRTYPRLASMLGFVGPDQLIAIVDAVIKFYRDHGDRGDRKRARLKYVVDDLGLGPTRALIARYFGADLAEARAVTFTVPDLLGWHDQGDGKWWLGLPVAAGRIHDQGDRRLRSALRDIATIYAPNLVLTPQQDVLLTDIAPADRDPIERILRAHNVVLADDLSPLAQHTLSCPALPTCGLALTEAERKHGDITALFDHLLAQQGLGHRRLSLRVTGCPNGCARSYAGDIGLVGRMPGFYAVYVGGDFAGTRLSFAILDKVALDELAIYFTPWFAAWAREGKPDEGFGDFCARLGRDPLLALAAA